MIPATRSDNAMTDMAAVMARVRKMSDSQLAEILSGKDVSVPQFAAMAEAMGRKQLRQAVQGAQAQQQAQQPSVKDQLLAEEAGLAALPAPNMESVDMASGGIIAFGDGGDVQRYQNTGAVEGYQSPLDKLWGGVTSYFDDPDVKERWMRRFAGENAPVIQNLELKKLQDKEKALQDVANTTFIDDTIDPGLTRIPPTEKPQSPAEKEAAAKAAKEAQQRGDYLTQGQGQDPYKRRVSPFGEFNPEAVDYSKLKDQGLGQAMLGASKALLSKRGAAGIGEAFEALGTQAGLTRKEIAGLQKDEREYKFNVAKANELFEQGQDEMAYKYLKQAQDNRYHMLMATKPGAGLEMLQALKDPANMKIWQQMNAFKKPTDIVSKEKALAQWKNVGPKERREKYGDDFNTYYNTINNQLLTDTIGDGADVLGKVKT